MPSARKTMKNTNKLPEHEATFHGLHHWHQKMFEKLGWMVLAQARGMDYKVKDYKKSLKHLQLTLEKEMKNYEEADRKHDLEILHKQVMCLQGFVERSF